MFRPFPVRLLDYDPDWPRQAAERAARLRVLEPMLVAVHHIGSTSVPGLIAKPIIDLMPLVGDLAALDRERGAVEALGYRWHGEYGIVGRRYCTMEVGDRRVVQLHIFAMGSPEAHRHLAFRDYLRAHPGIAAAYAAEKRRARDMYPGDSHAYGGEKQGWIDRTEAAALAWYGTRNADSGRNPGNCSAEMPRKKKSAATPGQRPLRVGEEIRHALSHILAHETDRLSDPDLYGKSVTVTEVRLSPDLRSATAFVVPLGATVEGYDAKPLIKALNRATGYFRGLLAREVRMQFSPTIRFKLDESFDEASRIQAALQDPAVARDLQGDGKDDDHLSPSRPSPGPGEGEEEGDD